MIAAIKPHRQIKERPHVASISANYNTAMAIKNPSSCADISRKPVVTVDSYGKVNSPAKSIDTGIIGTRKNAAHIKFIAIISTSSV